MLQKDGENKSQNPIRRMRWKVKNDEERSPIMRMINIYVCRLVHLLFTAPMVFFFSRWVSFSWAVLYATFAAIPLGVSGKLWLQCGAMQRSLCIDVHTSGHTDQPVSRSHFVLLKARAPSVRLVRPVAAFANRMLLVRLDELASISWIFPVLEIGCATKDRFSIYLAVSNYLAEIYEEYASSALAAQGSCRNLLGGIFPLVIPAMFRNLTFHGVGSLLGSLGCCSPWFPGSWSHLGRR